MSASVPQDVRLKMRHRLWARANELNWARLNDSERAEWYANWAQDKDLGGVLAHYMDPRKVRVYIKDSLLKPYQNDKVGAQCVEVLSALKIGYEEAIGAKHFNKPHGRRLNDGRVISWGASRNWKVVVFSVFERAFAIPESRAFGAVLLETGKTTDPDSKSLAIEASRRLGLSRIVWLSN